MSNLTYKEFYDKELEDNYESLNTSDPIAMEDFESYVKEKYNNYIETSSPGKIQNIHSTEYFSDLQEKFIKGFDQECLMSLIPARVYFFQVLSLIFKKTTDENTWNDRYYKIEIGNHTREINPVVHFFWQQETSSGKSRGHRYFINVCKHVSRQIAKTSAMKTAHRYTIETTKWTETQETFVNHFQQKQTSKGMQYDFTAPPVKGIFEEADILASEECAFLFFENKGDKQNISELLLDSLEGNEISKTLVSWNGNRTITRPNFVFSGLSRPTKNISKDFFDKGLFQRMIIYTRTTTQAMRQAVLEKSFKANKCPSAHFNMLAQEFEDLYKWKIKTNPQKMSYANPDVIENLVKQASMKLFDELNRDYKGNKRVRDGISPFISRYYGNAIYQLMILCALSRKSMVIEEQDFKEANYILHKSIESIKLFSEEQILPDIRIEKNESRLKKKVVHYAFIKKNEPFDKSDLELYLSKKLGLSLTIVATKIAELLDIGYLIENGDNVHINKNDYEASIEQLKDYKQSMVQARGKRR